MSLRWDFKSRASGSSALPCSVIVDVPTRTTGYSHGLAVAYLANKAHVCKTQKRRNGSALGFGVGDVVGKVTREDDESRPAFAYGMGDAPAFLR